MSDDRSNRADEQREESAMLSQGDDIPMLTQDDSTPTKSLRTPEKKSPAHAETPRKFKFKLTNSCRKENDSYLQVIGTPVRKKGEVYVFYLQKSLKSNKVAAPYEVKLWSHVRNNQDLQEGELGIAFVGERRGKDGEPMVAAYSGAMSKHNWQIAVAFASDVGDIRKYLDHVCGRLSQPDIKLNPIIFKYKPDGFKVTSYGPKENWKTLEHYLSEESLCQMIIYRHDYINPINQDMMYQGPLMETYFDDKCEGIARLTAYLEDKFPHTCSNE